ncbi:MAG: siphovirus ReqiPepy6 Gp37-like family protein [Clostridium sp.]|uniref:siphovirus ReqiPepy6 Gp37-like family protein n=1 Tax=Clostridium sp. TaxID=1506 RepID=UPI003060EE04
MDLEVYTRSMEFIGVVDNFSVLKWHRKYYKAGTFEITCPLTQDNLELLKRDNVIYKSNGEAGIILHRGIKLVNDKEVLSIRGSFLVSILNRRIIWDKLCYKGTVEGVFGQIVDSNCITTKSERAIPLLHLGALKGYTESIDYQKTGGNVLEELERLSNTYGIGFKVNFIYDTKELEFEVYKGIDRTENQSINEKALFSREYENILSQDYTESIGDYKNTVLVAGSGEGINRKKTSIETGQGLDRYEMYVDARDLQNTKTVNDTEVSIPDSEYIPMLKQRGKSKLEEYKEIKTFDAVINTNQDQENLVYRKDYDLGDIVTIFDEKWDITLDTRITEIEEIYQNSGISINVIFGNDIPTIYEKLKRM